MAISASLSAHHVFVLISLERLFSSFYPAYFERHSSRALAFALAIVFGGVSWLYSIACMTNYFSSIAEEDFVPIFNARNESNTQPFQDLMIVTTASNAFSLIMLSIDLYLNFIRQPADNSTLAVSYQRSENRRILLTILPIEFSD
ncbi:hypothetical protein PMAYCL1PPCAC_25829, partial [Pristionchus mayeri]